MVEEKKKMGSFRCYLGPALIELSLTWSWATVELWKHTVFGQLAQLQLKQSIFIVSINSALIQIKKISLWHGNVNTLTWLT